MCTHDPSPPARARATATADAADRSGRLLGGRYRLLRPLGTRGTLYLARRIATGERLTIRLLPADEARRLTAVRAAAAVRHGHLAHIVDVGVAAAEVGAPVAFVASEALRGENLTATLAKHGPLPWPRVAEISRQVCRALIALHDRGLAHGGVTADRCFRVARDAGDFVKLTDAGLARPDAAPADDLHALGVLMLRLLTAGAAGPRACPRRRLAALGLPPALAAAILSLLARDPQARPTSARALFRRLSDLPGLDPADRPTVRPAPSTGHADPRTAANPASVDPRPASRAPRTRPSWAPASLVAPSDPPGRFVAPRASDPPGRFVAPRAASDPASRPVESQPSSDPARRIVESQQSSDPARRPVESQQSSDPARRIVESQQSSDPARPLVDPRHAAGPRASAPMRAIVVPGASPSPRPLLVRTRSSDAARPRATGVGARGAGAHEAASGGDWAVWLLVASVAVFVITGAVAVLAVRVAQAAAHGP